MATIVTCINPVYPHEQFLQHVGTVLLLIPLFVDLRHDHMPMSAFVGLVLFTLFHVIGARYMYSLWVQIIFKTREIIMTD